MYLFIPLCILPDIFQLLCSDSRYEKIRSFLLSCTLLLVAATFQKEGRKTTSRLQVGKKKLSLEQKGIFSLFSRYWANLHQNILYIQVLAHRKLKRMNAPLGVCTRTPLPPCSTVPG